MRSEEFLDCIAITSPWQPMYTRIPERHNVEFAGWITKHSVKLLKPTGHVMHQMVQHSTTVRSAHTVFMCFVFICEKTATCATYSIN